MKKALLYLFAFLAIMFMAQFLVVAAYVMITGQPMEEMPPLWNIGLLVFYSLTTIVVFLRMKWFQVSRTYLRSRPWAVLAWSVVAALGAIVPSLLLQGLLPEWQGWAKDMAEATEKQFADIMSVPGGYIVVALLPPVVEEMVFRGCVLKSLLRWQPERKWMMIALSALAFSLIHMNPAQLLHTFLIGMLLGWMYMRTGSIVPGVAYHWANNTTAYVMFHVFHNPQTLTDIVGTGNKQLFLAAFFSTCILVPALYQLNIWMKSADDDLSSASTSAGQ